MLLFGFLSLLSITSVQACQPNVLLDDFRKSEMGFVDDANRHVCLRGGDYGGDKVKMDFSHVNKNGHGYLQVSPVATENHFFFKETPEACSNLKKFIAIKIVFSAPVGSNSLFTMTQKSKDCKVRINGNLHCAIFIKH